MIVVTTSTGKQQQGKTSSDKFSSIVTSACGKAYTSCPSPLPSNLAIMSSSIAVSTPTTAANVSPTNNNNNGSNHKSNSSSNNNSSQKVEQPYGGNATSPSNSDGNNSQNLEDSNGNNKNKANNNTGVNLATIDNSSRGERDSLSNISSNSLMRQGSASTNSCSVQFNESSPNNGDSSNSSSNVSHLNSDSAKPNDEEQIKMNQTSKTNPAIKEEEREKCNSSSSTSSSSSANSSNNTFLPTQTTMNNLKVGGTSSLAVIKDDKDLIKKEETSLSPTNMSPVGFGSIVGSQINECNDNIASSVNKLNDSSSSSCDKRCSLPGNVSNENDDTPGPPSTGGLIVSCGPGSNLNLISGCNSLNSNSNPLNSKSSLDVFCSESNNPTLLTSNTNTSFIGNNINNTNGPPQGGGGTNVLSAGGTSGSSNCMEYMQQQNHIFVFSTQLANKGADAVLGGQFPTIIAYHCTQPATKSFFEDFFLKNPMKMTKLQRQNTLNIMGGMQPGSGGISGGQHPWLTSNCNPMGKMIHKLALNKSETVTSSSSTTGPGAISENDMMCWDQTRSIMDGPVGGDSTNAMKILENVEAGVSNSNNNTNNNNNSNTNNNSNSNNNNASKTACAGLSNDDSSVIPSLQGVKVPDENLTPQQRQHREEQLAKLKKMNQFLFPENGGNDFHPPANNNPMMVGVGKMQGTPEPLTGGMTGNPVTMMNIPGQVIGNKLNPAMRNITGNLLNHPKTGTANSQLENIANLGEDVIMPSDMITGSGCGPNEMGLMPSLKQGCIQNMNNPSAMGGGGRGMGINAGGNNLNIMSGNSSGPCGMPPGGLMNDPSNAMMGNRPDVLSPFSSHHCPPTGQEGGGNMMGSHKNMNAPLPHPTDINPAVGMSQMEWSKLHHHIYEERLKNNHSNANIPPELGGGPTGCQQTTSLTRSNSTGVSSGGMTSLRTSANPNTNNRSNQGPPPPYHPTQRSASVPIATQSPNPSSPNNPTSNMSLPSPRASNNLGGLSSTTSPSMDASVSSTANTSSTTTTTTSAGGGGCSSSGNSSNNKSSYSQEGSPTPASAASNSNRNRSNVNNLNSNPTTPLSHVSPKEIDSMNMKTSSTAVGDHKSTRPSPQRSRSPLLNDVPNGNNNMEPRFPSPGLNFSPGGMVGPNSQNLANSFKNQNSSLERQNMQQVPPQFCRRTDNIPLNPNSNRNNQNKMSNTFDPISSLAQMSQQLTGCGVGLNTGGVGNSPNNMPGLMAGPGGVNDMNMDGLMGGPMMGGPGDPGIDHCNQNPNGGGNMGMSSLGGPGSIPGPFGPGNCNMMAGAGGPICQRLLNPKLCGPNMPGGFNPNQVGGMRDSPSGFAGMMPSHRMMNHRMSASFGNFNVSPNIQVKASTPNTIQYMPVRPQNNNNNMRVPPSLEFLQRYANPQMMGNPGGGPGAGPGGPGPTDMASMNTPNDLNKMPNTNSNMGVNPNAMNQMNFFGNCNQMSPMGGMGQSVCGTGGVGEQDDIQGVGMMSNHDSMNIPGPHAPMLRGMRPVRQPGLQSGVGMNGGSRMQHPGMANIPPPNALGGNPFPGNDNESLDCNDATNANMFNNPSPAGLYQQQKNKPPSMGMNHGPPSLNSNNSNNGPLSNNNILNDQNPSSNGLQNSVMMGPNNSMLNSNMPGGSAGGPGGPMSGPGNMGYKSFVGPTSSDLKYAQQYHSFQQQLYATSTRNQQPGGSQQAGNSMSPNSNTNAGFFVNK